MGACGPNKISPISRYEALLSIPTWKTINTKIKNKQIGHGSNLPQGMASFSGGTIKKKGHGNDRKKNISYVMLLTFKY